MRIAIHKTIISINAKKGFCIPKNMKDHRAFNTSCSPKIDIANLIPPFLRPCLEIKNNDIPIKKYKVVQTGANSQLGGLKVGFSRVAYQVSIEDDVYMEPIIPAPRHINIENPR